VLGLAAVRTRGDDAAPKPVHADAAALERALADTILALARADAAGMRAGFDTMERSCRRMRDDEPLPKPLLTYDAAIHNVLDRARELAGAGDVEHSAQQFCWIQSACRNCHDKARKEGLAVGKPAEP
jgi:hypothetical protein